MNKKINLVLAAFILGGMITYLPTSLKAALLLSSGLLLFIKYDEWSYERRTGGISHE